MKASQDIILKPVITEESMAGIVSRKYTFKVAKDANKFEIARAVEDLFPGTKVAKVNTLHVRGKQKRMGAGPAGMTRTWKKAYVQLTADSKTIEFFESMV